MSSNDIGLDLNDLSDDESSMKKRKILNACDACRKKKVKCDGTENTVCTNCKTKNITCSYTPTSTKRGPRQGYIETLEKRLELMEKLLQPLKNIELRNFQTVSSNHSTPHLTADGESSSSTNLRMIPNGNSINENSPLFRDIENYILPDSSLLFPSIPSPPTPPVPVVSPEVSEHLISLYFTYQHPLLSIIHRTTFINSLHEGKQCSLLLYTIYALASRFSNHPEVKRDPCHSAGEEYIAHAKILLESSSYSTPFLSTVQALVLMSLHEFGCDRYPTSWMYSGLAVRMGQHLNLYCTDKKDGSSKMDWIEAETRRRTWFGCCLMDRIISTKTSWPMAIHDEDCQVRFPSDDYNWENSLAPISEVNNEMFPLQSNSSNSIPDHMFHFGQLISLMGQINQYSNRSTNNGKGDNSEEELQRLDQMLNEWQLNLPPHLKYNNEFFCSKSPEGQMNSSAIILLHSLFHAITIVLHRSNIGRYLNLMEPINDSHVSALRCVQSSNFIASMVTDLLFHRFSHYIPFYPYALYTAGTIHANRSFSIDNQQAESSRHALEMIYKKLMELETYWGICKTYCTSLRGLYALRSSRDNISTNNGQENPLNCTVMSWLVPLKSSLHEWYPYLEKLSKDLDHNFCKTGTPSDQLSSTPQQNLNAFSSNINNSNDSPMFTQKQAAQNSMSSNNDITFNPLAQNNNGFSTANNINPTISSTFTQMNSNPINNFDNTNLEELLGLNPQEGLFNQNLGNNQFNFDFNQLNMMGEQFNGNMNEDAFFNMNLGNNLFEQPTNNNNQGNNFSMGNSNNNPFSS